MGGKNVSKWKNKKGRKGGVGGGSRELTGRSQQVARV